MANDSLGIPSIPKIASILTLPKIGNMRNVFWTQCADMCGLAGILGPGPKQIEAMVRSQHHRGPDAQGIFVSKNGGCALGHNRLSILDLSSAGNQPMSEPEERYWIILNGEVYNYLELRAELSG